MSTLPERFWAKVDRDGPVPRWTPFLGPCWTWTACIVATTGYGQIWVHGKMVGAHCVAYELHNGPIPYPLTVEHICKVRACVNPAHLELLTRSENGRRHISHNAAKTHCPRGHAYNESNTFSTSRDGRGCRECRWLANAARTNPEIADLRRAMKMAS